MKKIVWWIAVPIVAFFTAWLPYWIWNISAGTPLMESWWRVKIVPQGIFDAYIYLHWLGAYVLGNDLANQFSWVGGIFRASHSLLPTSTTIPELWIMSRWIAIALSIWVGSWCFQKWTGCTRTNARVYSVVIWVASLLALSFRPGITSTYWPIVIAGTTFVFMGAEYVRQGVWKKGFAWSLGGVLLASVYPWFFLFAGIWALVIGGIWMIQVSVKRFIACIFIFVSAVIAISPLLARYTLQPEIIAKFEMLERNGIVFSRVPFLSNTVLVMIGWILLFGTILFYTRDAVTAPLRKMMHLFFAWIVLFVVWFHTPFTGIFTHNDHFISIVQFLGMVSVLMVCMVMPDLPFKIKNFFFWAIGIFSTIFFLYILLKSSRGGFMKLDVYVIHLANWFFVSLASWMLVYRSHRERLKNNPVFYWVVLFSPLLLVSIGSFFVVMIREASAMTEVEDRVQAVEWIRTNISPETYVCAEPESAAFYSAHTGRPVLPSEGPIAYPESNETILAQLETISGSLNVVQSNNQDVFRFFGAYYLDRSCRKFARQISFMQSIGISQEKALQFAGCDQQRIEAYQNRVVVAFHQHVLNEDAFLSTCPYVIIDKSRRDMWHLPSSYSAVASFMDGSEIWSR